MSQRPTWAMLVVIASGPSLCRGTLSSNLFNGDFESTSTLKNEYSYDSQNNAIGGHRFNNDDTLGDWGKWIGFWGPPSLCWNGFCGQGGFSTVDAPRQIGATMVGNDLGNNNRSLDPYNPGSGNHIMETIAFRPTMAQWVKAPANQTTGPMNLKFDFYYNNWDPTVTYDSFQIDVYGSNFKPTHNIGITWSPVDGAYSEGVGSMVNPAGATGDVNEVVGGVTYRSKMLARFGWGDWWTNANGDPETGGWANVDSGSTNWWSGIDAADQGSLIVPLNLTETFQYYSITIRTYIYSEGHEYFWLVSGYGVNGYDAGDTKSAIGFDNIAFYVSTAPQVLIGDCNLDGAVNALDISCFVGCLTSGRCGGNCDVNGDGVCNALDISPFISCLTGGACAGSESDAKVVPEPAGVAAMLALVSLAILHRRR